MPIRHTVKNYVPGGKYHIYNRGTNNQKIFLTKKDYYYFLKLLRKYDREHPQTTLYAYVLMPNHIHIVLEQQLERDIAAFVKGLTISYSLYTTKRGYKKGPLFESRYKGRLLKNTWDLINLIRYVHNNPERIGLDPLTYEFSSIRYYLTNRKSNFVNTDLVRVFFDGSTKEYIRHLKKV